MEITKDKIEDAISSSPCITLGTDFEKQFAWCIRKIDDEEIIFIHKRGEGGWSYFNKNDYITAIPVSRILSCINRL